MAVSLDLDSGYVALVAALVVVAALGAGLPAVAGGSAEGDERHETQTQSADAAAIDERLRDANGTVRVVVRMSAERSSRASPAAERSPAELRRAARSTQSAFGSYAGDTDGVAVRSEFWLANALLAEVDTDEVALEELTRVDGVVRLHPNYEVEPRGAGAATASAVATAAGGDTTWGVDRVDAPAVWDAYDVRGAGVKVAVLDTGVDAAHSDIDLYTEDPDDPTYPGGWAEFDYYGNRVSGSEPHDPEGHGTHVSGTVAGGAASGTHVGVAPDVALMHGKVFADDGSGTITQAIAGMEWAVEENADVVSMSLGADGYYSDFVEPTRNARASGIVVVAAIGNGGEGTSVSPGNVYDVLSVGATDRYDGVPAFSGGEEIDTDEAWGSDAPDDWPVTYVVPDVAAPGDEVYSTYPDDQYAYMDGTSMATPHVAGVVALVLSVASERPTPGEVDAIVRESGWKPDGEPDGADVRYGDGIVDAYAASLGTLEGTVTASGETATTGSGDTSGEGDPIENATVTAYENGTQVATATTDADGAYALDLETGAYDVEYDHEDFAPGERSVSVDPGDHLAEDVALDYAETGTIRGELRFDAPTEREDVTVNVTATDADGEAANATVSLPAGETTVEYDLAVDVNREDGYDVSAQATGYRDNGTHVGVVDVNETVWANLTLAPENGTLEGNVTASGMTANTAGGGDPVANATVAVYRNDTGVANATTDGDGEYVIPSLPPDDYRVVADAEDYAPEEWSGWLDPGETRSLEFRLDYAEGGDVAGRVTGGEETDAAGEGLDGLGVTVVADDGESWSTTTNETGHYAVTDLDVDVDEDDAYTVQVDGGDTYRNGTADNVTVEPGERTRVDFALPYAPGTLAGEVTLAVATESEDVAVDLAVTNVDGEAANGTVAVPAGETNATYELVVPVDREDGYTLVADAEGYEPASVDAGTVGPGERVDGVDATLPAENATLAGAVTASGRTDGTTATRRSGGGDPIENATVVLYDRDGAALRNATTDGDGRYWLGSLDPNGSYALAADAGDYAATERSVDPDPGEAVAADVALDYAAGGRIEGAVELDVVDPDENVTVTVVADDGEHRYGTEVSVDGGDATADYALENVSVDVDSGYEVLATTDAAYANGSVGGVEVWVNETVEGVDLTPRRRPGSLDGTYEVNVTGATASVEPGETVTVDAAVTNVGGRGYRTVAFTVEAANDTVVAEERVVPLLSAGGATDLSFEWTPADEGEYTARVATDDDAETAGVEVERPYVAVGSGTPPTSDDEPPSFTLPVPVPPADVAVVREATADVEPGGSAWSTATFDGGVLVESVAFEATAVEGTVTVRDLEAAPGETGPAPGGPVGVSQVLVPPGESERTARLRLRIPRDELREAGVPPEATGDLRVSRFADGEWRRLPTEVVATDDGAVVLRAETPGFSYLAVTAVGSPEAAVVLPADPVVGETVTLDGSAASTPYGEVVDHEWTVDGETYEGETVTTTIDRPGEHAVKLTVRNDAGERATTTATLHVAPAGTPEGTAGEGSGFGAAAALVALLAVFLARRR